MDLIYVLMMQRATSRGSFLLTIFIRRTRHQQATPPRGNTRLSPMVPVGSYLESEVSPND